jgi:hypothetical protein
MPSILKVNQIQKTSSTSNIINKSGSTITLGASGTTVSLACGATQSGFAASSFVDWCTTAKTAPFTGANGTGYFVNTSCGAITVTLPATPTAGDIVSLKDYSGTWATNSVTLCGNSSKINGVCATATLNTNSQSVTLIYVDATKGWQDIQDSTSATTGQIPYIIATGGTVTTCGNYKIHTFTSDATFCVSTLSTVSPSRNAVDYIVVAGGGGGASSGGAGGGAGGFRESHVVCTSGCYTASPLASGTSLPVSVQGYPITIGGGGTGGTGGSVPVPARKGVSGSDSVFSTITSAGGGGAGMAGDAQTPCNSGGTPGGSGGGAGQNSSPPPPAQGGTGNTPPVSPAQGTNGGGQRYLANQPGSGGGGGATVAGTPSPGNGAGGPGGTGATTSILGSPNSYAGGGGGGATNQPGSSSPGSGGTGGGGPAGHPGSSPVDGGTPGTANTGGGGGGGGSPGCVSGANPAGSGGSGIVIIRYRYQ